ncbi:amino acid permease [Alicyclobacillus tolerans]|uniref:L-asparagine transporter-like permease n=1 Tax=Alicyclobacillus tolerans TaxID=90970 RepID=A0ABT9LSC9_9BACL|nr:amino acid permease [Alicyclobacillus tengchongensis]MDP9727172.1 L-asparagine transporter-like permease [Alicyclobacillus tengchongensis]
MQSSGGKRANWRPIISNTPSLHHHHDVKPEKAPGVPMLTLIGIGGIIGAGFFLGCGVPIRLAGPSVLIAFLIGGILTAQVTGALTSIAVKEPEEGSFKVYADRYLGSYAGYLQGWIYYLTSVLTIASEAVAMAVFTHIWLPHIAEWLTASIYSIIILIINAFGVRNFDRVESFMSVVKIAALVGFILFAVLLISGLLTGMPHPAAFLSSSETFFTHGFTGLMQSMLIVVFAYAGIGVFATAAVKTPRGRDVELSAILTILILTVLYIVAVGFVIWFEPTQSVNTSISPFVLTLQRHGTIWLADIFNAAILIASFSVMAGAVFSSMQILYSLGETNEAPRFVKIQNQRGVQYGALLATAIGIALSLILAYALPSNVYQFLISASSFMTFFYWFVMLLTFISWRSRLRSASQSFQVSKLAFGAPVSSYVCLALIVALTIYALFQPSQRIAFYAFAAIYLLLTIAYWFVRKKIQKSAGS